MSVRLLPVKRAIVPVLLFTLSFIVALAARSQAQVSGPWHWSGGTTLLGPLKDGSGAGAGTWSPYANAVSADGRFVVFKTAASTVVPGDTNGVDDIFVRDRVTNLTTRVNVSSTGEEANAVSDYPSISADGRFVTFASAATNLVPGDTNGQWDIFVRDRVANTTSLVSLTSSDGPINAYNSLSAISADGRYVAFVSLSTDLAPGITAAGQLFLRDRDVDGNGIFDEPGTSRTTIISVADDGTPGNANLWPVIDMTPDGRYVTFASQASNLVTDDTNGAVDVFVRDLQASHTWRASVATDGTQTPAGTFAYTPSISADGRYVAFESDATTLVGDDTNGQYDVFVHDSQTGETTRVTLSTSGAQGDNYSGWASISDDGRYVAFHSSATTFGGTPHSVNLYVRDRQLGTTTAVSSGLSPSISGDGSTVVFSLGSNTVTFLYAAVDFSVTPASLSLDANGSEQTVTVTTTPGTGWSVVPSQSWITPTDGDNRAGTGTLHFTATPNTGTTSRTATVTIGTQTIGVTQAPAFTVQSVSPTSGTASGGTTLTITGSGFLVGAAVQLGGVAIPTTWVSDTTLRIVTPWHYEGAVDVQVINSDGATRVLTSGYRFVDTTPPVVTPTITGTLGNNGWYVTNVAITWAVTDPESAITSSSNCNPATLAFNTNPTGMTFQCTATSSGGTTTGTTPIIKRDAIQPWVDINGQVATIYEPGQSATASYTCSDSAGSGIDTCVGSVPSGSAVDTSTPGIYDVAVTATDKAGLSSTRTVNYGVTTGVCTPLPADIVSWWSGDNTLTDRVGTNHGTAVGTASGGIYGPGLVGSAAFQFSGTNGFDFGASPSLRMTTAFSVTAWVYATASNRNGKIFDKRGEYGLELGSGTLYYTFGTSAATDVANYTLAANTWTHLAMTYDAGALTIYANGRLVKTVTVAATLVDAMPGVDDFMVGRRQEGVLNFTGGNIDDVQVYRRALTPAELESMFLSGRSGMCTPAVTALTASSAAATYGSDATATLTAQLTAGGAGVAGRTLVFSISGTQVGTAVTDSTGNASLTVSVANKNAGTYTNTISVSHSGDGSYASSTATATLTIAKRPTSIVWATPAPITYGTNLSSSMFNATTSETVSGSFAYTPAITSTPPNVGSVTLNATFTPSNTTNYLPSSASVILQVLPATPTITLNASTFTYDKQSHPATVSATGTRGETFTPTVTYNGSGTVPVDAGDYTVVASLAATANYSAATATATLTIRKATPNVTVGTIWSYYTYDGTPHSAIASATGVGGEALTPVTITYDAATDPPANAGLYTLVASYAGSPNYDAKTATGTLDIRKTTVSLSAGIAGSPMYDGNPHSIASASATGVGGEVLPVTVSYNGVASPPINPGDYAVVVSFEGSQNYLPASMSVGTFTISKALATLTMTGGAVNIGYDGTPHGITATVAGIFGDALTPVTITYNGSTTAPTNAGTYNILVSYPGSSIYFPRSASTWLIIGRATTMLSWTVPQPLVYGQPLGPAQLNATATTPGTFTYTPAAGTVPHRGNLSVQATFTPTDATNYTGGSLTQTVVVNPAALTVKANDAAKVFGAPLPVFTASYAGLVNGDTPASLAGTLGFGTTATDQSAAGTYPITVGGVSSNDYATSFVTGVLTVQPAATSTVVNASANPSGVNQPVTFTASVSVTAPGTGQPTGTLTFRDGSTVLGAVAMQSGTASLTTILATGTHAITATYSGDGNFATSSSASLSQTVNASSGSTTTTVSSSLNPSKSGQSVTLTARVTSPAGTPTGDVQFLDSDVVIGTGTLSGGTATLTTTALVMGSHAITVRYLGSATMPPSLSATLVQVVNTSNGKTKSTTATLSASPSTGSYGTETAFTVTVAPPLLNSAPTGNVLIEIDGVSATILALSPSGRNGIATLRISTLPRGKHLVTVTYLGDSAYAGSTAMVTYTVN